MVSLEALRLVQKQAWLLAEFSFTIFALVKHQNLFAEIFLDVQFSLLVLAEWSFDVIDGQHVSPPCLDSIVYRPFSCTLFKLLAVEFHLLVLSLVVSFQLSICDEDFWLSFWCTLPAKIFSCVLVQVTGLSSYTIYILVYLHRQRNAWMIFTRGHPQILFCRLLVCQKLFFFTVFHRDVLIQWAKWQVDFAIQAMLAHVL